jgi:TRAP-type uncharacterized transport system substrate-binding protein
MRSWRTIRDGTFAVLGLAALGLAAFVWLHEPAERPIHRRMTAGRSAGERGRIAEALRREAAGRSLRIDLVETVGSDEALREVDTGRIDMALAQGGLDLNDRPNLRQVAALHVEPLHLLVRPEYHEEVSRHLSALKGKVVNLGEPGSGTFLLATEVMASARLYPGTEAAPGDFTPSTADYDALLHEQNAAKLPDAVFTVSSLPSPVARRLVQAHGYRLVALPFSEAFRLNHLQPEETAQARKVKIDRAHVYDAEIPAFTYGVEPAVPAEKMRTLGTRLLLVAHKDVPSGEIERLLEVVFGAASGRAGPFLFDAELLELRPELAQHEGTIAYLRRNAPLIAGDAIDLLEKEVSILAAVLGGLFFLGQWVRRQLRLRRDRCFQAYILRVNDIERRALAMEEAARLDFAGLALLRRELAQLKAEALEQFAAGTLEGEELMSGFLTHVSDTRDYLTRLALHERENLEEEAGSARLGGASARLLENGPAKTETDPAATPGDGGQPGAGVLL